MEVEDKERDRDREVVVGGGRSFHCSGEVVIR